MRYNPELRSAHRYQLPSGDLPVQEEQEPDFSSILDVFLRRKILFFAIFLAFFGLIVLITVLTPRSYTATTKLIAGAGGARGSNGGDTALPLLNALLAASSTQSAETFVDLVQQYPVAHQVVQNLNLKIGPRALLSQISVKPITNTSIIDLSATWRDPEVAAKIANEFAAVFVTRERLLVAGQAGSALDFLSQELPSAAARMHAADNALADFEAAHPDVYTGNGASDSSVLVAQQKYAQAQVDREQAQAQLANVSLQLFSTSATVIGASDIVVNPVTSQLRTQLAQVQIQYESARQQYTDNHPTVLALKEQIAQLKREIDSQTATVVAGNNVVPNPVYQQLNQQAATLRTQIAGDTAQLKSLKGELGQKNGMFNSLPAKSMQLANLQRNAKMAEDVYTALQQKYNEATVAKTTALSDVSITQPALADDTSVKPNWKLNLLIGFVLGLVLATSGVFVVEFFDNTFKNEEDVERVLSLPLLTSVPQLTQSLSPQKLSWLRALTIESFLQLVTALRYSADKPLRTLAITSPHQGDGKSTIAMSTAIALAEVEGKVLLIDADLRRPTLHARLGLLNQPGLTDYIVHTASLSEAVQATKYDGLFLMSSGTHVPNPMKLIHSSRVDALIVELLKEYRAVIFDTPALLPVYDAAILASKVDGTVLVISAGATDARSTKKVMRRLDSVPGVNTIGIVLNRITPTNGYYSYYLTTDNPQPLPHEDEVASQN